MSISPLIEAIDRGTKLLMKRPPSIIPHVKMTAGNRRLTVDMWRHMHLALNQGKDIQEVAERFGILHKNRIEEIQHISRHFAHAMGVNYPVFSDAYWQEHLTI
jgi:hypothetical protein